MGRQFVMLMIANSMVLFARGRGRVNVNRGIAKVRQMMQELMPHFTGNLVTLFDRKIRLHSNIDFGQ